jgi:hypothetical protein
MGDRAMPTSHDPSSFLAAIDAGEIDRVSAALLGDPSIAVVRDADGDSATMHALYRGRHAIADRN